MKNLILVCVLLSCCYATKATHYSGGEMSYKALGNDQYEVTLILYQDCLVGAPAAIADDNPVYVGIYKGSSLYIADSIHIKSSQVVTLPLIGCTHPTYCFRKAIFTKVFTLPSNSTGYLISYQRCCRGGFLNIEDAQSLGTTLFCTIPAAGTTNNSAVFREVPPNFVCLNEPFAIDISATDADGDQLIYTFYEPLAGGSPSDPKPIPAPPPYAPVVFAAGFSYSNPMGGTANIDLDSITGMLTGTPTALAKFLIPVACKEYRNGQLINTVLKEFNLTVISGWPASVAAVSESNTATAFYQRGILYLSSSSKTPEAFDIRVFNSAGKTVYLAKRETNKEIKLDLPSGIYIVELSNNKTQMAQKFIVSE